MRKVHSRPEFSYIHLYPEDTYDVGKSILSSSASRDQSSLAREWKASIAGNREDSSGA